MPRPLDVHLDASTLTEEVLRPAVRRLGKTWSWELMPDEQARLTREVGASIQQIQALEGDLWREQSGSPTSRALFKRRREEMRGLKAGSPPPSPGTIAPVLAPQRSAAMRSLERQAAAVIAASKRKPTA
jgi:hypothetical protein